MGRVFKGKVRARVIELRFATSGRLTNLFKKRSDSVEKGEIIASLDKKLLQAELDKQLGDYEKVRADFEIFNLQKGEPKDDITKYLKTEKQAELNVSVKEVELAKARLDQTDLFSPIEGMIIDDSNLVAGIYITPASGSIKILDTSSYYFEAEIDQEDFRKFSTPQTVKIKIPGLDKELSGNTKPIISSPDLKLRVEVEAKETDGLVTGLAGEIS